MNVALNICGKNIKILSIEGKRVKKWGMAELPPGLVRDGLILEPKTIGPLVNDLFKKTGIPRDRVTASVAGLSFTYRFFTLPKMKSGLIEEAVLRAAKKEISIPLEDLYISWQRLPDIDNEMSFFLLGVERNRVEAMLETLKEAHITPYLMGIRPLALARVAERKDAILINIEECCFDIVIMSGGLPRVIHTITPRDTNVTLEDNIHRLADELTKTATFYQSNNPDAQLDNTTPLLLTGDWMSDATASALLQTEVDYPISRLVAQVQTPKDFPMDSFAAVIGLALKKSPPKIAAAKSTSYTDININVLAGKYRKPKAKPVSIPNLILWILLAAAVLLIYPLQLMWTDAKNQTSALEISITEIQRQITFTSIASEEIIKTENQITALISATQNVTAAYQHTLANRSLIREELELVNSLIPADTYFTSVEAGYNEILIYGEADSVFTVIKYAEDLQNQAIFREVRIDELTETTSTLLTGGTPDFPAPVMIIRFFIIITT